MPAGYLYCGYVDSTWTGKFDDRSILPRDTHPSSPYSWSASQIQARSRFYPRSATEEGLEIPANRSLTAIRRWSDKRPDINTQRVPKSPRKSRTARPLCTTQPRRNSAGHSESPVLRRQTPSARQTTRVTSRRPCNQPTRRNSNAPRAINASEMAKAPAKLIADRVQGTAASTLRVMPATAR